MRDRLIELFKKKTCCLVECDHDCVGFGCLDLREGDVYPFVDYLLANGVIVPPCKVGDTVYQTDGVRIYPSNIQKVIYDTGVIAFDETAIGKSVFLTEKEAEKALAERGATDETQ